MQLPQQLLETLIDIKSFDKEAFEKIHASGEQVTSIRINPSKLSDPNVPFAEGMVEGPIPWTAYGYYLKSRPSFTFDPRFHAGCYYVQEASSMFLEQALKQTLDLSRPIKVLDLCAAPGGKSTHIQSLISENSLLVSNEVIRSRANILKDNIIKWGAQNVVVTNNDPRDFAGLENYFDVIVVDAPCSGSGLFRRDAEAIDEWSLNNVALCCQRQQRILADIWPALKKDGVLIYSTCSYSKEEDENIVEWLAKEYPAVNLQISLDNDWHIEESGGGYRFWPDKLKGEGFFIGCFRKAAGDQHISPKARSRVEPATKKETEIIANWVIEDDLYLIKSRNSVYAWPPPLANEFNLLLTALRVVYSGTIIGEFFREKLVPDHALAMSNMVSEIINTTALTDEQAIGYLQKKDLLIEPGQKGWQLVTYEGHSLGWINALPNRINNYYPKELRILKDM